MSTTVSVLIPQYGRTSFSERAVAAVRRSRGDLSIDVHVHDNASESGPGAIALRGDVDLTTSSHNLGFGPAMNRMADASRGEYLLLLNNDTIVHPNAINRMVETAATLATSGPVVPMYRDFRGRSLELGGGLGRDGRAWQLFHGQEPPTGLATTPHRADYGSAAAMLIRRDVFLEAGGFDDVFAPAYYEDTDLCLRLAADGHPTVVEPRALVFHFEGGTAGTDLTQGLKTYQVRNRSTFVRRWAPSLEDHGTIGLHRAIIAATEPDEGQPRVLWLSPVLPRGDRDGGGRRTIEMLTSLRAQGVGIAFHARSCNDSQHYGPQLAELGIPWFGGSGPARWTGQRRPTSTYDDLNTLLAAAPWDAIVVFSARYARWMPDRVEEHAPDAALVIDNGDLHYLRHDRGREIGVEIRDPLTKDQELDAYAAADGVITSSGPEDAALRDELRNPSTHVFTVAPPEPVELPPAPDGSVMFLGNFSHPPNTDAVEHWVHEVGPTVRRILGHEVPLRVVGAGTDGLESDESLDVVGWVPDLADEFARTRVFLAPLRYGAGTKGKLVEAMAHGVPVVTTPTGAEGFPRFVVDAMRIGNDADELAGHTAELFADDEAWQEQRRRVADAASEFYEHHRGAGAALAAWLLGRAIARRQGAPRPTRVAADDDTAPTDVPWIAEKTTEDRPFTPADLPVRPTTTPNPVFVVGAPRSGTSMMAHALGAHPMLWTGEESDFLDPLVRHAREAWEMGRTRGDLHWLAAGGVSWNEFAAWLGTGMNAMYTTRSEGRRWVEQTPRYTLTLPLIADMFPDAQFVYMLRDGRSVVHSLKHFVRPVEHERAAKLWARHVRAGLDFADSPRGDRIRIVDYRKVITDTVAELSSILEFLGLPHHEGPASFIEDGPINSSFSGESSSDKTAPRWSDWTREERETFHAAAGEYLVDLGFEPDSSWLDTDSSWLRKRLR